MIYKVAIEEHIVQEFEVEANSPEEAMDIAQERYNDGEYVLDAVEVQSKQVAVIDPEDEQIEWREF